MVDCAHGTGAFATKTKDERIEIEKTFINLIKTHTIQGVSFLAHTLTFAPPESDDQDVYSHCAESVVGALRMFLQTMDLDLRLNQHVTYVDALPPGAEITVGVPSGGQPVALHYENLFGMLYHTELAEAGNRFRMTARKTWWWHRVPTEVRRELPAHWWRRRG